MLDKPTFAALRSIGPSLGHILSAGHPELHWSCPRRYSIDQGVEALQDLGASKVSVLDYNNRCTIQQDLNLPWDWRIGWFNTILDVGTIEHIADPFTCLCEYTRHLKLGGHLVISTVYNQHAEHGYWQPSPRFFYDFLNQNGFIDVAIITYSPFFFRPRQWKPNDKSNASPFTFPRLQLITATKVGEVKEIRPPIQQNWSPPFNKVSLFRRLIRRSLKQLISSK